MKVGQIVAVWRGVGDNAQKMIVQEVNEKQFRLSTTDDQHHIIVAYNADMIEHLERAEPGTFK